MGMTYGGQQEQLLDRIEDLEVRDKKKAYRKVARDLGGLLV